MWIRVWDLGVGGQCVDTCLDALSISTHRFVVICYDYVSTAAAATTAK